MYKTEEYKSDLEIRIHYTCRRRKITKTVEDGIFKKDGRNGKEEREMEAEGDKEGRL